MMKSILALTAGIFIGIAFTICGVAFANKQHQTPITESELRYPVKATLYRFKLNKENIATYHEWVQWHHDEYGPMIKTLERERMYFESVFRDTVNTPDEIYWLSINGEGGETSNTSTLEIDKKHNEYMKKILVKGSGSVLKTEFSLIPDFITQSITEHQRDN
ncbi:hypothetical protein D0C36_08885 [Mucilaginibacter conchicola]|uniref:Uncharacterized protein n=1 Tax=Mucilaginibacter conchicola TaxID=2303333 RepID=A0A372P0H1_9SPHI|nr:DUF6176 family protein [Mucilaginibacter conchicola]RFZ95614.1 hypothetical protein D0C36_08885 [Mucilaginibacter conchicola]